MGKLLKQFKRTVEKRKTSSSQKEQPLEKSQIKLKKSLASNKNMIIQGLGSSNDVVFRSIVVNEQEICLVYLGTLADKKKVSKYIIEPLGNLAFEERLTIFSMANIFTAPKIKIEGKVTSVLEALSSGLTIVLLENEITCLIVETSEESFRGVEEPVTEQVARGPREGFVESLDKNISLIRKRLKTPDLRVISKTLGKYTKTNISVCYIDGIVKPEVVKEVLERLDQIKLDGIIDTGYIEEFVEDAPFSPFQTVGITQRPDVTVAKILEGRVAILCDGSPVVLTVPFLFIENLQAPDDYYNRPIYSSLIRMIRLLALGFSILLPAVYVGIINYHPEFLPTKLILTIAAASEGVPFPKFVEISLMAMIFEILREAGLKIPTPMGQAVSIVGALVLGEAAVGAGLVGQPVVIVTSLTAISSFAAYSLNDALPTLRLIFLLGAAVLGLLGVTYLLIGMVIHLASIRSFGVNYLSPISPLNFNSLKDTLIRAPLWLMGTRPTSITDNSKRRESVKPPRRVIMDD